MWFQEMAKVNMRQTLKGAVQKTQETCLEAVNNSVLEAKIKRVLQFEKKTKLSPNPLQT